MKLSTILLVLIAFSGLAPVPARAQSCITGQPITFGAGVADAFAAPPDPTSRGAALNAAFPTLQWKDFDDMTSNRFVGHTFLGLPPGIVRAELELRLVPHADVPDNDTVSLGLLPGSRFARSFHIAGLPEAQGSWSFNAPTTFKIPLGATDGDVLAQMATQNALDVLIGDDTAVDSMKLRVWTCPSPIFSGGLPFNPLGEASAAHFTDGTIKVTNPGEGLGGLRFVTSSAAGLHLNIGQLLCLTQDVALYLATHGGFMGTAAANNLTMKANPITGLIDIMATFPKPFDCSRVHVLKGTTPVFINFCQSLSQVIASVPPGACIVGVDWIMVNNVSAGFSIQFSTGVDVTLPGGSGKRFGDRITIDPSVTVGGDDGYGFRLSSFDLQTTGVSAFTIDAEKVQAFGLFHSALGTATFEGTDSGLTLSTPGPDGGDGVAIDLPQSKDASLTLAPLDPLRVAPDGAFLQADLTGSLNGRPGQALGTVKGVHRVSFGLNLLEVTPDFSALGAPTHRVEVYDHGTPVTSVSGHSGPASINIVVIWPVSLAIPAGGGFSFTWPGSGLISISGGPPVVGDEIRFVPEPSSFITIDNISGLALRVAGLPAITLTDARTTQCSPPVILSQPANVSTAAGRPALFSVTAAGDGPLTYRWRHNGLDLAEGNRYSGTATSTLSLSPTILAQAGTYDVVVGNACGSVVSTPATYAPGVALRSLLLSLVGDVQSLTGAGALSSAQADSLSRSLLNAIELLRAGNLPAAVNRVDVFIFRVNAFVRVGSLSASRGKTLTDAAGVLRARLID